MGLRDYLIKRILQTVIIIFVVLTINFFLFRILPGDPVRIIARDPRIPPETRAAIERQFGLDKPLWTQYFIYLANTFQGNLGVSFVYRRPVAEIVGTRLLNTILLVGSSTVLAIIIGVLLGVVSAWKRGGKADVASLGFSLLTYSMPAFWLGMILVIAFRNYFPFAGMITPGVETTDIFAYLSDLLSHLILPSITLTLVLIGGNTLVMRSSLLDVLFEDYITTARAKGLSEGKILLKHAIPNAMLPMATTIAINLGLIVGGAIQTETVFSWPGVGRLIYDSLMMRDYPILQGSFLVIALSVILANLCADLVYGYIDPRVKY